jgi:hypothetical protein
MFSCEVAQFVLGCPKFWRFRSRSPNGKKNYDPRPFIHLWFRERCDEQFLGPAGMKIIKGLLELLRSLFCLEPVIKKHRVRLKLEKNRFWVKKSWFLELCIHKSMALKKLQFDAFLKMILDTNHGFKNSIKNFLCCYHGNLNLWINNFLFQNLSFPHCFIWELT